LKGERKIEVKRGTKKRHKVSSIPLDLYNLVLKVKPEEKDEGKDRGLSMLGSSSSGKLTLRVSKEMELAIGMAKSTLGNQIFRIDIGYAYAVATNGSGFLSVGTPNSNLPVIPEFASFALLFSEFFVISHHTAYQPNARYNIPLGNTQPTGGTAFTQTSGTPIGLVALYHDQANHTNINTMVSSPSFKFVNSADPWDYTWHNNERADSDVMTTSSGTAVATQSWCSTAATPAAAYTGTTQILGSTTVPTSATMSLGILCVKYHVLWRNRA
jgi:hypothetical protein